MTEGDRVVRDAARRRVGIGAGVWPVTPSLQVGQWKERLTTGERELLNRVIRTGASGQFPRQFPEAFRYFSR